LLAENYSMYLYAGHPVAINGRYLLPVLFMLPAVLGKALHVAFSRWQWLKAYAVVLAIVLFLQGGGVFSFILRSDATWYWPGGTTTMLNETAQNILDPLIWDGPKK